MADDPRRGAMAQWRVAHVADASSALARASSPRTRSASADSDRKGARNALDPRLRPRATTAQPPHRRPTTDTFSEQRERQRDMQEQLARRLAAQRHGPASSGNAAYVELVSPARPTHAEQPSGYAGQLDAFDGAPRSSRRTTPADAMDEIDEELRRSFGEHQRSSVALSRDAADHSSEDFGEQTHAHGQHSSPPPMMEVRVQHTRQPFREEISSDLSDHPARSPVSSAESTYRMSHEPISEDLGLHFPLTRDFETIPSISLTPPASPAHHHQAPSASRRHRSTHHEPHERNQSHSPETVAKERPVFTTWSLGFLAGCAAVGFGGMFMDELLQFANVFFKTSPLMLSRIEQREMNRRLDLLQQELLSFRIAANEIELQSQRMVQEVRSHLEKMKMERERHQQMISREMDALRQYVQGVTNELVEDEKKEIRKRLMETIAETVAEHPGGHVLEDTPASKDPEHASSGADQIVVNAVDVELSDAPADMVEVSIIAEQGKAASLFEEVDEDAVMAHIQEAIAEPVLVPPSVQPKVVRVESIHGQTDQEPSSSLVSFEWMLLLAAIAVLAGVVGLRVRNAVRRKSLARRSWRFPARPKVLDHCHSHGAEDSEVETVSFFCSDNEASESEGRYAEPSDDDGFSTYSEEQKDGEDGESDREVDEEGVSASSEGGDYEFHAAELSGEASDIEAIDESPSEPSTPFPRMHARLESRLTDDSPSVRRSPRIQTRSTLSQMR